MSWKNLSLAGKLYASFGIMAFLIAAELFTLIFALHTLSAVRAFVGGEGLWSKAQKDSAYYLRRYAHEENPEFLRQARSFLEVQAGDRRARLELEKPNPDLAVVRQGFIDGKIDPADIDGIVRLFRRFGQVSYLARAIKIWKAADELIFDQLAIADEIEKLVTSGVKSGPRYSNTLKRLADTNAQLTRLENDFSYTLGEGSRWLEGVLIVALLLAVMTVELTGLSITFSVSRSISKGLSAVDQALQRVSRGELGHRIPVRSKDELGRVAGSVNRMFADLEAAEAALRRSHADLERKIEERTRELQKAVRTRQEFLSIASHELKTPLTSMKLHLQMSEREARTNGQIPVESMLQTLEKSIKQVNHLGDLIERLLDVSRVDAGRLRVEPSTFALRSLLLELLERLKPDFHLARCELRTAIEGDLHGEWDRSRVEQIFANLFSNAVKYAPGAPIELEAKAEDGFVVIAVRDHGPGVPADSRIRIFERFERAASAEQASGLGLGLYISKEIAVAHGGEIHLEAPPGGGAKFVVRLPLSIKKT